MAFTWRFFDRSEEKAEAIIGQMRKMEMAAIPEKAEVSQSGPGYFASIDPTNLTARQDQFGRENPLPFFQLLPSLSTGHPTHNRQVEDGGPTHRRPLPFKSLPTRPAVPTIFYSFHRLITA
jgi:hypothetical protein